MKTVKKLVALCFVAVLAVALAPAILSYADHHEEKGAEEMTVSAEPVDMVCYMNGQSGEGHAACATACANKGNPIGLLVDKSGEKMLMLAIGGGGKASKDLLASHMGKVVEVTGTYAEKDGLKVFTVSSVAAKG
jgi:predicted lipoprotein with Yx(FWY)xxD motif